MEASHPLLVICTGIKVRNPLHPTLVPVVGEGVEDTKRLETQTSFTRLGRMECRADHRVREGYALTYEITRRAILCHAVGAPFALNKIVICTARNHCRNAQPTRTWRQPISSSRGFNACSSTHMSPTHTWIWDQLWHERPRRKISERKHRKPCRRK